MNSPFINFGSLGAKELPLHRNLGMEITYISEGALRWVVDGRSETLYAGSVFFTLPWQAHGGAGVHEPGNRFHFVLLRLDRIYREPVKHFGFAPELDIPEHEARRISRIFAGAARHTWRASEDISLLLPALIRNLEREAGQLLLQGYTRSVLAELADIITGTAATDVYRPAAEQRVVRFLETLRERCDEPWSQEAMCTACRMGRTLFTDTMHRLTGDTPMTHLRRLRVERAEHLLHTTDDSITDIALSTGFSTTQLFARTFKAFTNCTPTAYREQMRSPSTKAVIDFTEADENQRHARHDTGEWL